MSDEKATILIVDDAVINIGLLEEILNDLGYNTCSATGAAEATEILGRVLPQLVLLDIMMPDINGYEFCEMLKKNPHTRDIPVIFVSAAESDDERERAFEIGGVDFIRKPFDVTEIKTRVRTHISIYNLRKQLEENNKKLGKVISEQSRKIEDEKKRILKNIALLYEEGERNDIISANSRMLAQALNFTEKYENKISGMFIEGVEIAAAIRGVEYKIFNVFFSGEERNASARAVADVIQSCKERWDGTGTPEGLKGESIPLAARIVAICAGFDSYIVNGLERSSALDKLQKNGGSIYDPYLVDLFLKIEKQIKS